MYVCLCKAVTDREIRCAVERGNTSLRGLREELGCTGQCGKCAREVRRLRDETLDACQGQALSAA